MTRTTPRIFIFSHHKAGTMLFLRVMAKLASVFGLSVETVYGMANSVPSADIVHFGHSLVGFDLDRYDFRGIHLVRDPRDIWVSGYLYHCRCSEEWCVNEDFRSDPPILYPRVDYSQQHESERSKQAYLAGLGGRSYQRNLLSLDQRAGLPFELDRYAGRTIEAMAAWVGRPGSIKEMKLEEFAQDYDTAMTAALTHLGFDGARLEEALAVIADEDITRMSEAEIDRNPHIYSRQLSKWRDWLGEGELRILRERYPNVTARLGYPE